MSYYITFADGPAFSSNPVQANKTVMFSWTVKNTGDEPAVASDDPFRRGFFVAYRFVADTGRSVEEGSVFVVSLAPGEISSGSAGVSFGAVGMYRLTLCADPASNGNGCGDSASAMLTVLP
jgi:hypothetical protein